MTLKQKFETIILKVLLYERLFECHFHLIEVVYIHVQNVYMSIYLYIFTFYALELGRMLHVFYIASFSMYVDEWFIYANFQ